MTAGIYNATIDQGATWSVTVTYTDSTGAPINLTGYTAAMQVRQQYNSTDRKIGYNLTKGDEGNLGLKMSDETKEKIRQKHLGSKWSNERKLKHSETLKSKNIDHSKGIENCKLHNLKTSKKVGKFDLDLKLIISYDSITDTASNENISRSNLQRYLRKNRLKDKKDYKGFIYQVI